MSEQASGQPEFFSPQDVESGLIEVAGRPKGQFTGALIEKQAALVDLILERFATGASQREIARLFSVSPNTVAGVVARATASGRIEAYKTRVSAKLAGAIEGGIEVWTDALRAGQLNPAQIPLAVGIFSDKKALLDGEATSRVEVRSLEPSAADVARALAALPEIEVVDYDSVIPKEISL